MLKIRDLWADYGGAPVLRGVSLDVAAGEVVGLVGPNGSGKTTLVRAVTRVMPLRSGEVRLLGQGAGDHHLLPLTPRELVGEARGEGGGARLGQGPARRCQV